MRMLWEEEDSPEALSCRIIFTDILLAMLILLVSRCDMAIRA